MKNCLFKVTGRALLKYEELYEVLLDLKTFQNKRPLRYMEEGFEQPVITANLLLREQPAHFLEENDTDGDEPEGETRR